MCVPELKRKIIFIAATLNPYSLNKQVILNELALIPHFGSPVVKFEETCDLKMSSYLISNIN